MTIFIFISHPSYRSVIIGANKRKKLINSVDPQNIYTDGVLLDDSNTELIKELQRRGMGEDAKFYATSMIYDAYFTMNKDEWIDQENQEYRHATELRFKKYYLQFEDLQFDN